MDVAPIILASAALVTAAGPVVMLWMRTRRAESVAREVRDNQPAMELARNAMARAELAERKARQAEALVDQRLQSTVAAEVDRAVDRAVKAESAELRKALPSAELLQARIDWWGRNLGTWSQQEIRRGIEEANRSARESVSEVRDKLAEKIADVRDDVRELDARTDDRTDPRRMPPRDRDRGRR